MYNYNYIKHGRAVSCLAKHLSNSFLYMTNIILMQYVSETLFHEPQIYYNQSQKLLRLVHGAEVQIMHKSIHLSPLQRLMSWLRVPEERTWAQLHTWLKIEPPITYKGQKLISHGSNKWPRVLPEHCMYNREQITLLNAIKMVFTWDRHGEDICNFTNSYLCRTSEKNSCTEEQVSSSHPVFQYWLG